MIVVPERVVNAGFDNGSALLEQRAQNIPAMVEFPLLSLLLLFIILYR